MLNSLRAEESGQLTRADAEVHDLGETGSALRVVQDEAPEPEALALGFGGRIDRAVSQAQGSLRTGFAATRAAYDRGWHQYVDSLKDVPASAAAVERPGVDPPRTRA